MGKRANENAQQSREDWEGEDSDEEAEPTPPAFNFKRASEDELKSRKILRASGHFKSLAKTPASSSNPFATVSLSSTTTPTSTSRTNPFANILLQPAPQPAGAPAGRLMELIQAFQRHIQNLRENRVRADWSRVMQQFKENHRAITLPAAVAARPAPVAATMASASAHNMSAPSPADTALSTSTTVTSPSTSPLPADGVKAGSSSIWKKFHETKVKCYCFKNNEWSAFKGLLSLEHSGNSKILVIRDEVIGHLRLNVALPTDISYHEEKDSKGVLQKTIKFFTKEKAEEPLFVVRLKTAPENLTPLYNAIQELAAKSG
jgi:hypothetical protein